MSGTGAENRISRSRCQRRLLSFWQHEYILRARSRVCRHVCFVRMYVCLYVCMHASQEMSNLIKSRPRKPEPKSRTLRLCRNALACLIVQLSNAFCFHNDVISEHVHTHTDPGARTHKHTQSRARGTKQEMPRAWPGDLCSLGSVAGRSLAPSSPEDEYGL